MLKNMTSVSTIMWRFSTEIYPRPQVLANFVEVVVLWVSQMFSMLTYQWTEYLIDNIKFNFCQFENMNSLDVIYKTLRIFFIYFRFQVARQYPENWVSYRQKWICAGVCSWIHHRSRRYTYTHVQFLDGKSSFTKNRNFSEWSTQLVHSRLLGIL